MSWLFDVACTRGSRCTTSRIHQHTEKNSVPLKEVLTGKGERAQRSSTRKRARRARDDARLARIFAMVIRRECRKCLRCSTFFDRCLMRAKSLRALRDQQLARKARWRGLRVAGFGNEKIFVLNAAGASLGSVDGIFGARIVDRRFGSPHCRRPHWQERTRSRTPVAMTAGGVRRSA